MKGQLVRLGKQTVIYGIGGVAVQVLGLLTLPVYARVFSPAEYGVIEVIVVAMAIVALMVDAGFASALQRSYFDYTDDDHESRGSVVFTAVATSLAIGLVAGATLAVFHRQVAEWLFGDTHYANVVLIASLALPATGMASLTRQVMRLRFQPWRYLTSSLIAAVGGTAVALVAVLPLDLGAEGVFVGSLSGALLSIAYNVVMGRGVLTPRFSRPELRTMLAFGLPLLPAALALWVLQFLDRLMLSRLGSLSDVGEYAVANRVAMPLLLLITAFGTAYSPFMLSLFSQDAEEEKRLRGRVLGYVVGGLLVAGAAVTLAAEPIVSVLAPRFHEAYTAVWLLVVGTVAFGTTTVTTAGLALARRTRYMGVYSGLAALLNAGLNLVLIPAWGMRGAALATAVAYVFLTGLYYLKAQQVYPTPYRLGPAVAMGLVGLAVLPLSLLELPSVWLNLAVRVAAFVLLVGAVFATGVVGREEVRSVRDIVRSRRSGSTELAGA